MHGQRDRQANGQLSRYVRCQIISQLASRQEGGQRDRQTNGQLVGRKVGCQIISQLQLASRQAGRQSDRQASGQSAASQLVRFTDTTRACLVTMGWVGRC